jgi:hypothetical protein
MSEEDPGGRAAPHEPVAREDDLRPDTPERSAREARADERRARREHDDRPQGMIPGRERRRTGVERGLMRFIATGGIVALAVVLGAVLVSQDVAGWITGLVIGLVTVVLAALLWSSRQL